VVGEGAWGGLRMGKSCTVSTCGSVQPDGGGGLSGCSGRRKGGSGSFLPVGCFLAYRTLTHPSVRLGKLRTGGKKE